MTTCVRNYTDAVARLMSISSDFLFKQTQHVSVVTLDWIEIMGGHNTADSVVRDRRMK